MESVSTIGSLSVTLSTKPFSIYLIIVSMKGSGRTTVKTIISNFEFTQQ